MPLSLLSCLYQSALVKSRANSLTITTAVWYDVTVTQKNPHAVALGRKGGKKGGKARMARLTAAERSELARRAIRIRWARAKSRRESQEKT